MKPLREIGRKSNKELLRGEEAAYMAAYRLRCEIERSYTKDPDGYAFCMALLKTIDGHLDDIGPVLANASDDDAALNLAGINNAKPDTMRERGYYLIKRADEIEGVITALPNFERRKPA